MVHGALIQNGKEAAVEENDDNKVKSCARPTGSRLSRPAQKEKHAPLPAQMGACTSLPENREIPLLRPRPLERLEVRALVVTSRDLALAPITVPCEPPITLPVAVNDAIRVQGAPTNTRIRLRKIPADSIATLSLCFLLTHALISHLTMNPR